MDELTIGRLYFISTLMFHIVFVCIGIAMPFLMAVAHWRWLRTNDPVYKELTKVWSKGVAIFFAVGAVSGTVVTFQLGLIWPTFMREAGPIIGLPLALEGAAFFTEAVALGLFLYGWNVLNKWVHFASGLVVGLAGVASGYLVTAANGWMNAPVGFETAGVNQPLTNIDPLAAMFNTHWLTTSTHMAIAAFVTTGFAVAGIHAWQYVRTKKDIHGRAMRIALAIGALFALAQPFSGHSSAELVAHSQPLKLAAMEVHFETEAGAGLLIGGIPNLETGEITLGFHIPSMLSLLAFGDANATVLGLNDFPRGEWPPVLIVHLAYQAMVGIGFFVAGVGLLYFFLLWRKRTTLSHPRVLWFLAALTPLGLIATEAGWVVTEIGRQPWIIYNIMTVEHALTPMTGLIVPFLFMLLVYAVLFGMVTWLMLRQIRSLNERMDGKGGGPSGHPRTVSPTVRPAFGD
jgi:cytochrome d ubiquinol oxidase subunit I